MTPKERREQKSRAAAGQQRDAAVNFDRYRMLRQSYVLFDVAVCSGSAPFTL